MDLKKILPAIIAGFIIALVEIIPIVKNLTCCVLVPIVVYYAMTLEIKGNKKDTPFTAGEGIRLGILTGILGAFFAVSLDSLLTFILKTNDFVKAFPQMEAMIQGFGMPAESQKEVLSILQSIVEDIRNNGISAVYIFSMLVSNVIFNIFLGLVGGAIDVKLINKKYFK